MSLGGRFMAAVTAFKNYDDSVQPSPDPTGRYALLWSFYTGQWLADPRIRQQPPQLYENARMVFKHTDAVVSLYQQFVYAGDLSTDGLYLPDGTRGAIPIDPQVTDQVDKDNMLAAFHQLFSIWQWRQYMSLRPKMGAVLGSVLTELVDDPESGVIMPNLVWPGYVPLQDLELDYAGNVKRYAVEYHVHVVGREAFGEKVETQSYDFRKEVTSTHFRYYKDGKPFAYPEYGQAVQDNPYGFAPAIWDRHEMQFGDVGMAAIEKSMTQLMQTNGTFSHALDYLTKQFAAPVGLTGSVINPGRRRNVTLPKSVVAAISNPGTNTDEEERRRSLAEDLNIITLSPGSEFVNIEMNLGQTLELLKPLIESLLRENPEAEYGSRLLQLSEATGPGLDRILAPITGKVRDARKNYDPQTVKLLQMGVSMMAFNLIRNYWSSSLTSRRAARYEPFSKYDLDSYFAGLLDCTIPDRPVFTESLDERVDRLTKVNSLIVDADPWILKEAGVPEEEIKRITKDKEEARAEMDAQLTGIGAIVDDSVTQTGMVPKTDSAGRIATST